MKERYKIIFYTDKNDISDVEQYIANLHNKNDKDSRVNFNKIVAYLDVLEEKGNNVCYPLARHIEDDIWELRPLKNRIMYAYITNRQILILSHFVKKTAKTPKLEIEKAITRLKDYLERYKV